MKKVCAVVMVLCLLFTGCSGVSQEEYDDLAAKNQELLEQNNELNEHINTLTDKNKKLENDLTYANIRADNNYRNYISIEGKYLDIVNSEKIELEEANEMLESVLVNICQHDDLIENHFNDNYDDIYTQSELWDYGNYVREVFTIDPIVSEKSKALLIYVFSKSKEKALEERKNKEIEWISDSIVFKGADDEILALAFWYNNVSINEYDTIMIWFNERVENEYNTGVADGSFAVEYNKAQSYSESIEDEGDSASIETTLPTQTTPPGETQISVTLGMENALKKAQSYLDFMAFSYLGLIEQLEYEGYTPDEAKYGVDNCGADWNEQAAKKAASYLEVMNFSKNGLIEQLEYEGFTHEQAVYGAESVGY